MRHAHRAGLRTTATMMYGTVETMEERLEHLFRLRDLQDETGGFTAFITWSYQPQHTELGGTEATGVDYLRTLAIARLVLDNFDNLQASWVTQGGKVGQLSLAYGANDMGSVMIEENVVRAAGAEYCMDEFEVVRNIENAGFVAQAPQHALRDSRRPDLPRARRAAHARAGRRARRRPRRRSRTICAATRRAARPRDAQARAEPGPDLGPSEPVVTAVTSRAPLGAARSIGRRIARRLGRDRRTAGIVEIGAGPRRLAGAEDLGDVALLPGLVNAHTHLELSWMAGRVPPAGVDGRVDSRADARVRAPRSRRTASTERRDAMRARRRGRCAATGTVLVGDISNTLHTPPALARRRHSAASSSTSCSDSTSPIRSRRWCARPWRTRRVRRARASRPATRASRSRASSRTRRIRRRRRCSPRSRADARRRRCRFTSASRPRRSSSCARAAGRSATLLEELGVWTGAGSAPGCDPVEYLHRLGYLQPGLLAVHAVHLTRRRARRGCGRRGAVVVTCPRSNEWVGAGLPRVSHFYAAGVPVAIGTDSLASAPSLNLFDELAELRRIAPDVDGRRRCSTARRAWAPRRSASAPSSARSRRASAPRSSPSTIPRRHDAMWKNTWSAACRPASVAPRVIVAACSRAFAPTRRSSASATRSSRCRSRWSARCSRRGHVRLRRGRASSGLSLCMVTARSAAMGFNRLVDARLRRAQSAHGDARAAARAG